LAPGRWRRRRPFRVLRYVVVAGSVPLRVRAWRPSGVGWPSGTRAGCPCGSVALTELAAGRWPSPLSALTLAVPHSAVRLASAARSSRRVRVRWPGVHAPLGLGLSLEDTSEPPWAEAFRWRPVLPVRRPGWGRRAVRLCRWSVLPASSPSVTKVPSASSRRVEPAFLRPLSWWTRPARSALSSVPVRTCRRACSLAGACSLARCRPLRPTLTNSTPGCRRPVRRRRSTRGRGAGVLPVRGWPLSRPPESCRTPLMGFVWGFAPPSTSAACVHSRLAAVPVQAGCPADWACDASGLAPFVTAAASLRAFGPGLPVRDVFRPCRFSRLRRLAPHARRRLVASCSRPWGSPGCRQQRDPDPPHRFRPPRALRPGAWVPTASGAARTVFGTGACGGGSPPGRVPKLTTRWSGGPGCPPLLE
jgi:hypothetical protein